MSKSAAKANDATPVHEGKPTVGVLTVGQTPRVDIMPALGSAVGLRVELIEWGALDGLTAEQIDAIVPADNDDALIARLADGSETVIGKAAISRRLQSGIDQLQKRVDALTVLCSGTFPPFRSEKPLLNVDRILRLSTEAVFQSGRLGVLIPITEQEEVNRRFWTPVTSDIDIFVASPYQEPAVIDAAGRYFSQRGCTLIVGNCMGYGLAVKQRISEITKTPVFTPLALLGLFIREMMGNGKE